MVGLLGEVIGAKNWVDCNNSDEEESNDGSNEGESTEEDDEAELSTCSMTLVDFRAFH